MSSWNCHLSMCVCVCVGVAYTQVIVDVYVVQPAQVLVRLQETGELMMLSGRLGQQLPPLPLLHVPAEKEVSKVLYTVHTQLIYDHFHLIICNFFKTTGFQLVYNEPAGTCKILGH